MVVYLDNNATTPLDGRVLEEMLPYLRDEFGNASSASHAYGWTAGAAVDVARERLAEAVGASPEEVYFTSGATESDNLALRGVLAPGDHLIVSATEHEAVLATARLLERDRGVSLTVLPVDRTGRAGADDLGDAIRPETKLVSVMLANNETGTVSAVRELAVVAHERGVPFHTDAAQALGKMPLDVERLGVEMMSLSAHKVYGPKGVGAVYVRRRSLSGVRRLRPEPQLTGGGQERGLRSGTPNVPGIVGFGKAAELAHSRLPEESGRVAALRDELARLLSRSPAFETKVNGHPEERLPNTLNITFGGLDAGEILAETPEIAASTGSACASRDPEPSHVLLAMGLDEADVRSTLRLSLGRFTTREDVGAASKGILRAARSLAADGF